MNDRKIITEKELNYIETLYLYCNIEDFINIITLKDYDINLDMSPPCAYDFFMNYHSEYFSNNSKYLGTSKGREWYKFDNYRIGIMPYDTAKKANQFNCVIQYEQHYMFELNKNLTNIILPFDQDFNKYHIKRIDITKIAKVKKDYTKNYGYISPFRRQDNVNGTVYLGNRKNGNVFRMYDKTKELLTNTKEHPINYKKIELLSSYFGDIEDLYTFELELSRVYLKNTLGIDTLSDLSKVYDAYHNIVGGIRFYVNNDKNKSLIKNNNRDRVSCRVLTDFVYYERVEKKKYKKSYNYALNAVLGIFDNYIDSMGLDRTNENYMMFINSLMIERVNQDNKDLVITFEDSDLSIELQEMSLKHTLMRENENNELEKEAKQAFG